LGDLKYRVLRFYYLFLSRIEHAYDPFHWGKYQLRLAQLEGEWIFKVLNG